MHLLRRLHDHAGTGTPPEGAESHIMLDRARFLAEKIFQIDYVNPYNNKQMSVLLHTKEQPEVTELLDIISENC